MVTTDFKNMIMDNLFHTSAATPFPQKYYLAWSPTPVSADGIGFTEPAGSTGYTRVELTGMSNANDGTISNTVRLAFNESVSHQGTTHVHGLFSAMTGGKLLLYENIAAADKKTIEKGTTFYLKPNELRLTLKGL